MAKQSLAVKYRPSTFQEVCEQEAVVKIFEYMVETKTFPNSFLLTGPAGTGKTTLGRILAKAINDGKGTPIEIDAASNSGVDNVRTITEQARYRALDAEYRIFIVDEAHSTTTTAWQAYLKALEDPSKKSVYIFCTTDPQKIPNTILSRVQRFDLHRITFKTIVNRLKYIVEQENLLGEDIKYENAAFEYIAKIADGGMRDAITMMDKCLGYSKELNVSNVIIALGAQNYSTLFDITNLILDAKAPEVVQQIEDIYLQGQDLKQFISHYTTFLLDCCKYKLLKNFDYIQIPVTYQKQLDSYSDSDLKFIHFMLERVIKLGAFIKWESLPKTFIEAELLYLCTVENLTTKAPWEE